MYKVTLHRNGEIHTQEFERFLEAANCFRETAMSIAETNCSITSFACIRLYQGEKILKLISISSVNRVDE